MPSRRSSLVAWLQHLRLSPPLPPVVILLRILIPLRILVYRRRYGRPTSTRTRAQYWIARKSSPISLCHSVFPSKSIRRERGPRKTRILGWSASNPTGPWRAWHNSKESILPVLFRRPPLLRLVTARRPVATHERTPSPARRDRNRPAEPRQYGSGFGTSSGHSSHRGATVPTTALHIRKSTSSIALA